MELDVQLSKDGEVVVFHDDTLDRVTGVAGRVDAFDWAELKEMPLCGTEHHMPLFRPEDLDAELWAWVEQARAFRCGGRR